MFPQAAQYTTFQSVTNPYEADIDGVTFLGTAGQNVDDIHRYTGLKDSADIAQLTLESRHIAPTCPDTLGCYPFTEEDPFILRECPHIYFAGNQKKYNAKIVSGEQGQRTLVISVPKFIETKQVVLVNLKDLNCFPISVATLIGSSVMDGDQAEESEEDDEGGDDLPNVNIVPDEDMDE